MALRHTVRMTVDIPMDGDWCFNHQSDLRSSSLTLALGYTVGKVPQCNYCNEELQRVADSPQISVSVCVCVCVCVPISMGTNVCKGVCVCIYTIYISHCVCESAHVRHTQFYIR